MVIAQVIQFLWLLSFSNSPYPINAACCSVLEGCSRENTTAPQLCGTDSFQLTSSRSEIYLFCNYEGDLDDLRQTAYMRWQIHAPNAPSENGLYLAGSAYSSLSDEAKWTIDSRPGGFIGQANRSAIKTEFGVYTSFAVRRTVFSTAGLWAFSCEITLTDSSIRYNYTVDILDPQPKIVERSTPRIVARMGESTQMQCTVDNLGRRNIQWDKANVYAGAEDGNELLFVNNHRVTTNTRFTVSTVHTCYNGSVCDAHDGVPDSSTGTTTLYLNNAQPDDTGLYQCQVMGPVPQRREFFFVVEAEASTPGTLRTDPELESFNLTSHSLSVTQEAQGQTSTLIITTPTIINKSSTHTGQPNTPLSSGAVIPIFGTICYTCQNIHDCILDESQIKTCPDAACWTNQRIDANGIKTTHRGCSADVWPTGPNAPPREGCVNNYKTKKCYLDSRQEDCLVCCERDRCNEGGEDDKVDGLIEQQGGCSKHGTAGELMTFVFGCIVYCHWLFQSR